MNAIGSVPTIAGRVRTYADDVGSFMSSPSAFLDSMKNRNPSDGMTFLIMSASLAAVLAVGHQDVVKELQSQDLWAYAWTSFRSHVFPALLFALLQSAAIRCLTRLSWHEFFSVYACSLGVLLVIRSVVAAILSNHNTERLDYSMSTVLLILLLLTTVWKFRVFWVALVLAVFTIVNGYVVGMFETAVRGHARMGVFGSVTVATRLLVAPVGEAPLQDGTNRGRLRLGDLVVDGRYEDNWILEGKKDEILLIEVSSRQFDTFTRLETSDGRIVEEDDDSGGRSDAKIEAKLDEDGKYTVVVTSFATNSGGNYTVTLRRLPSSNS